MKVKLGEYIQEYSVRNKANEDIPVYSVTNTQGFCQDYFGKEVASKDKSTYKIVPRGYFAYNPSRINVGSVDWQRDEDKVIVSPLYNVFSVSPELNQQYLYYYLKSDFALHRIKAVATGSVRDNLKLEMLKNFPIRIPRVEEQEYIVQVLDKAKNIINLRRNELQKLDDLIKARFVEMFGDPIENPRGYYVATLQDLIEKGFITYHLDGNHGGDYPRSEEFVESGIPYISANCIVHGEIDFAKAKYLTPERAGKLRKGIAQNEDVLFAHNATVGPTVVLHTDEEKVILGTSLTAYRCNQEEIMPNYLKAYMMSNGFVRQYSSEMKQTTRNQVPITAQKKYQFLIPPIEEQKQFTDFVNQIDKSKLLSGCRLFHSWAPENRDKPKHVGVPRRRTKDLRGCQRQQ